MSVVHVVTLCQCRGSMCLIHNRAAKNCKYQVSVTCWDPALPNRIYLLKDGQNYPFQPSVVVQLWLLSVQSVNHCILYRPWHTCWYKWSQQQWARYSNQEWITHSELHSDKSTNSNRRWSVWNKLSTLTLYILMYNICVGEWRAGITSFCSF